MLFYSLQSVFTFLSALNLHKNNEMLELIDPTFIGCLLCAIQWAGSASNFSNRAFCLKMISLKNRLERQIGVSGENTVIMAIFASTVLNLGH